jgi:hypothetical protein
VFETVVRRCMAEGLVSGEGVTVDASMVKAGADRQRDAPGSEGLSPGAANHAIRLYVAALTPSILLSVAPSRLRLYQQLVAGDHERGCQNVSQGRVRDTTCN